MVNEKFWKEYERYVSNPVSRFIYKSEIEKMEQEINNHFKYVSSYTYDGLVTIDNTNAYNKNMKKIVNQEDLLKKQINILEKSFLLPRNKLNNIKDCLLEIDSEKYNFKNYYEDIVNYQKNAATINDRLDTVSEVLQSEGLYLTVNLYSETKMGDTQIKIVYENDTAGFLEKKFNGVPSVGELISYAQEEKILTKTPANIQKKVLNELNKINFSVDDVPYSYANHCADYVEVDNVPAVFLFDDSDRIYERLMFNSDRNRWFSSKYQFDVLNPVTGLTDIYNTNNVSIEDIVARIQDAGYYNYSKEDGKNYKEKANCEGFSDSYEESATVIIKTIQESKKNSQKETDVLENEMGM